VSLGVCEPLQGSCIHTHGWFADNVWIARHAREAVPAFAQDHFIALFVRIAAVAVIALARILRLEFSDFMSVLLRLLLLRASGSSR
jgi:hypothetical protein